MGGYRPVEFSSEPGKVHVASVGYDFAADGGTVGSVFLPGIFPAGAIILGGTIEPVINFAGGPLWTLQFWIGGKQIVSDINAFTVAGGIKIADHSQAFQLLQASKVEARIIDDALSAGRCTVHVEYYVPPSIDYNRAAAIV